MLEQLKLLIRSGNPIISIDSRDEQRTTEMVRQLAIDLSMSLYEWSITTGMVRTWPKRETMPVSKGKAAPALEFILDNEQEKGLYLFKDLGPYCRDPLVQHLLRDLQSRSGVHLIMVDGAPLTNEVRRLTVPIEAPLPDAAESEKVVRETFRQIHASSYSEVKSTLTKRQLEQLVQTLHGLTGTEAARVVASAIHLDDALTNDNLPHVVESKRNLLQSAGCLEAVNVNFTADEIGGMDNLKRWLALRRQGMTGEAQQFGLDPPRGILLLGVQGCGKSLCAKVVAADWHMPLLRMDPGVLYQKFVGESENRLRQALGQAESMAPAVLWIDEIEKAFASASTESADGGLSQRMFGTLLSWMQDHRSPIFMVATANNIAALPPELMRKGRFDEVFFVDLPDPAARQEILAIHLQRRRRDPQKFALEKIASVTEGFSGAELEQLVVSAMYAAFSTKGELLDKHLEAEAQATRPLSVLMGERVDQLRAWAKNRCVPAD